MSEIGRNKKKLQNFGGGTCGGQRTRFKDTATMYFREVGFDNMYWIGIAAQGRARCRVWY